MGELLQMEFMRHALVAALLVGLAAPSVGVFLVQRRMSLIGDGMGHVALAGVAIGLLTGQQPVVTALVLSVAAAVAIELIRIAGRASADIALAVMFYGGMALGVVLISKSSASSPANLTAYLFGSILTTSRTDIVVFALLAVCVLVVTTVLRQRLFAVANDPEYARTIGLPVTALNLTLAVLTAVTVVTAMRVVGLLLISALMILPNAAAQVLGRSFRTAVTWAVLIGVVCSVGGVVGSFYAGTPSGGTIVLVAIGAYLGAVVGEAVRSRVTAARHRYAERHEHEHAPGCGHPMIAHGDHVDYLHDGHRHAAHEGHYDEHHPAEHEPVERQDADSLTRESR